MTYPLMTKKTSTPTKPRAVRAPRRGCRSPGPPPGRAGPGCRADADAGGPQSPSESAWAGASGARARWKDDPLPYWNRRPTGDDPGRRSPAVMQDVEGGRDLADDERRDHVLAGERQVDAVRLTKGFGRAVDGRRRLKGALRVGEDVPGRRRRSQWDRRAPPAGTARSGPARPGRNRDPA